jgi:Virulence factor
VITTYKILYWQEVPSQIRAEDEREEVTVSLPARFIERIDQLAAKRGLQGADDYLAQWQWGDEQQRDGAAQDVADAVRAELEAKADW